MRMRRISGVGAEDRGAPRRAAEIEARWAKVSDTRGLIQVLAYLGRYTHRVAISNGRLVAADGGTVTFRYRDRPDGDAVKVTILVAHEFIRRVLMHLPAGRQACGHAASSASATMASWPTAPRTRPSSGAAHC